MKRWSYSLAMLVLYLAVFLFWKHFPSRAAFVGGGLVAAGLMAAGMVLASRRRYFANRLDLLLHAYVIVDVLLEGFAYEALRLFVDVGPPDGHVMLGFHDNNNFYGCALAFALIVGGHRFIALRRNRSAQATSGAEAAG